MRNLRAGWAPLAALALVAAPAAARDPAAEAESRLMEQGKMLAAAGRFAEVLPIADRVIAMAGRRIAREKRRIYSGQSSEMLMANMLDAATAGTDAIDVGPAYGEAQFWRGYALVELGRGDEAGKALDEATRLSPANPQFLCEAGTWHNEHRDFTVGLDLFRRCEDNSGYADALGAASFRAAAQRGRGYALIELGRLDEAEDVYKARLAEEPGDAKARSELDHIDRQRHRIGRSTS